MHHPPLSLGSFQSENKRKKKNNKEEKFTHVDREAASVCGLSLTSGYPVCASAAGMQGRLRSVADGARRDSTRRADGGFRFKCVFRVSSRSFAFPKF